ncbi:MAG TPA: molybdopterin-guanine dinucleotide biosynthesis protein B [Acidobacteriota bacterium]|nr:molybdopterin-guanine dinucleotide biosynthesis protein B [Acidobacteriota bacterium]
MALKRVHIVGGRNQGKTTLIEELLGEFASRGLKVGTIKHTRHAYDIDTPGKDSYRHHQAGSHPWAIISGQTTALFLQSQGEERDYLPLEAHFSDCHLVLVEGHLDATSPRIEVWRAETGEEPLALSHPGPQALVSDDPPDPSWDLCPEMEFWPRSDLQGLADRILELADSAA